LIGLSTVCYFLGQGMDLRTKPFPEEGPGFPDQQDQAGNKCYLKQEYGLVDEKANSRSIKIHQPPNGIRENTYQQTAPH